MADATATDVANEENTFPGLLLGINSLFSTLWWVVVLTVYVKNHSSDENLKSIAGIE